MTAVFDDGRRGELRPGPWPALASLQVAQMFKACVKHCARIVAQRGFLPPPATPETEPAAVAGAWQKVLKLNRGRIAFVCGRTKEKQLHPLSYLLNRECVLLVARLASKDDVRVLQRALGNNQTDPFYLFCVAILDAHFRAAQHGCKGEERRTKVRLVQAWLARFYAHYADFDTDES